MIDPKQLPRYRPLGRVLVEFTKDGKFQKRKGAVKWTTEATAKILKEKGVAKVLKTYTKEEIDELVVADEAKAAQAAAKIKSK